MLPRKRPVPGFAFRTRELDRLRDAIEGGASIVTLTGAPGIGKTALLLQWLATAGLEAAGWHVLFVDSASCHDIDTLIRNRPAKPQNNT
jgi:predicted ATP-dependent serine protease